MNKIKLTLLIATLAVAHAASAQDLCTGYFNDNYLYRHDLNPAFGNEKNYISVPLVGNANINMRGNLALKNVLYNVNGRTALYLNPAVSASDFDAHVKDTNKFTEDLKVQLMGAGFSKFGGYNTVEINFVQGMDAHIPGTLLRATKDGLTNQTYDFANVNANISAYAELALGHSRQVNDNLRLGAKVKLLFGIADIDMNVRKATLALNENNYTAVVDADVQTSMKEVNYSHNTNKSTGDTYVNGTKNKKFGISGFGLAADLGADYKAGNWDFSLAVQNIGFISYGKTFTASTNGEKTFETNSHIFSVDDKADNSFENEKDKLKDEFAALYQLTDNGNTGGRTKMLGATVNFGAKYTLPSFDKMSFGLMNSTRIQGKYSWTDFRIGANYHPYEWLALSANVSAGTYGVGFGWMVDVQAKKGIDFFVGMDTTPGKLTKQCIPLSSNMQFSAGINVPF